VTDDDDDDDDDDDIDDDDDDDEYLVTSFRKDIRLQYCASRFAEVAINDHSHKDIYQECARDLRTFGILRSLEW
jgi:hypothetical protein